MTTGKPVPKAVQDALAELESRGFDAPCPRFTENEAEKRELLGQCEGSSDSLTGWVIDVTVDGFTTNYEPSDLIFSEVLS